MILNKDPKLDVVGEAGKVGAFLAALGAGAQGQATPSTNNGNLVAKVKAYATKGT